MLLKKIGKHLAFVSIAGYMFVLRTGNPTMWLLAAIAVLWATGLTLEIWRSRSKIAGILKELPASLWRSAPGDKPPARRAPDRWADRSEAFFSAGIALFSIWGIVRYLVYGERGNGISDTALTVFLILFFITRSVRRRRIYLAKTHRAIHR